MGSLKGARPKLAVFNEFEGQPGQPQLPAGQRAGAPVALGSLAAQTWLTALASHCESAKGAQAKQELSDLLRCGSRSKDKTVATANAARQQIAKVFSWTHHVDDVPGTDSPQRARQCQYLYERVLHGVLLEVVKQGAEEKEEQEAAAPGGAGTAAGADEGQAQAGSGAAAGRGLTAAERGRRVEEFLADAEYQMGLVSACVEVVNFAYLQCAGEAFPWATLLMGRMHSTLELWQAIDWVTEHLAEVPPAGAEGSVPCMPEEVVEYLSAIQIRVEEELAFIDSSSLYRRILATGGGWDDDADSDNEATQKGPEAADEGDYDGTSKQRQHQRKQSSSKRRGKRHIGRPGPDAALVARFLSNLGRTTMYRTISVAKEMLGEYSELETICPALPSQCCVVMDLLLSGHLDLLFGQHMSVALACAIYFTVRLHGGVLPFRKITSLMAAVLPNHDESTFARVELPPEDGTGWDGSVDYGDARAYYNRVFLPVFAEYDAADLFGDELLAPTPSKQQLEAPEPALPSNEGPLLAAGGPGGGANSKEAPLREVPVATAAAAAAGHAAQGGTKELRRLRKPLGQVTNSSTRPGLRPR